MGYLRLWWTELFDTGGSGSGVLPSTNQALITIIALVVTVIWAVATVVAIFERDYTGLSIVTPVMLVVTGCLFAIRNKNGNGGTHA